MKKKDEEEDWAALAAMRDADIDVSDLPERLDWTGAVRGKFYKPRKQTVTMRLDADIVAWFKANAPQYQTAVNQALREYVAARSRRAR